MIRRSFLKNLAGTATFGVAGCARSIKLKPNIADVSFEVTKPKPSGTMPTGEIGKTGIQVSRFSFGSHMSQQILPFTKERELIVREAFDLGITCFDVYDQEWNVFQYEPMGRYLAPVIRDVVISISFRPYDGRTFEQEFERDLRLFGRDYIDLVRIYAPPDDDRWEKLFRLKEKGYIRAVGVPIHYEKWLDGLLGVIPLDFVILPYNFYHNLLYNGDCAGDYNPLVQKLRKMGIGVITMKPFGSDWFITPLIKAAEQLDKTGGMSVPRAALRYIQNTGLNPDTTLGGMYSLNHVYENVAAYYKPALSMEEKHFLERLKRLTKVAAQAWFPDYYRFLEQWVPDKPDSHKQSEMT
jgi:aryl-alcohol dehydrogenase-like predicted oxidoreductase